MSKSWKEMAEAAMEDGYIAGNATEKMLENAMPQARKDELGAELEYYLIVQVSDAMDGVDLMMDQGMDSRTAMELAISDMMEQWSNSE